MQDTTGAFRAGYTAPRVSLWCYRVAILATALPHSSMSNSTWPHRSAQNLIHLAFLCGFLTKYALGSLPCMFFDDRLRLSTEKPNVARFCRKRLVGMCALRLLSFVVAGLS
jgi:hypothetical protein